MKEIEIEIGEDLIAVELSNRVIDHFTGMRGRKDGKMLFDFGRETSARIDMFLVRTELFLYFLDEKKEIIEIQDAEPWTWNPRTWKFYRPNKPYRYLLESSEPLNLEKGQEVIFEL